MNETPKHLTQQIMPVQGINTFLYRKIISDEYTYEAMAFIKDMPSDPAQAYTTAKWAVQRTENVDQLDQEFKITFPVIDGEMSTNYEFMADNLTGLDYYEV